MKKILIVLAILGILLFSGCTNLLQSETSSSDEQTNLDESETVQNEPKTEEKKLTAEEIGPPPSLPTGNFINK